MVTLVIDLVAWARENRATFAATLAIAVWTAVLAAVVLLACCHMPPAPTPFETAYPTAGGDDPIAGACDEMDGPHTRKNRTVVIAPGVTLACY